MNRDKEGNFICPLCVSEEAKGDCKCRAVDFIDPHSKERVDMLGCLGNFYTICSHMTYDKKKYTNYIKKVSWVSEQYTIMKMKEMENNPIPDIE